MMPKAGAGTGFLLPKKAKEKAGKSRPFRNIMK
jgi:hypothetical protein